MDPARLERLQDDLKELLDEAAQHQARGNVARMRHTVETAMVLFGWMQEEGYELSAAELEGLQNRLRSLGYNDKDAARFVFSKKKKKLDFKGTSSGGSEHRSSKSPSKKEKHQKGRAAKRKSYGGEKGDDGRRYPRKPPFGWVGPWPPLESEGESMGEGSDEGIKMATGRQLYNEALKLAQQADRNGGPLPVSLLREAADTGYAPAVYALANWHIHGKGVKKNYKLAVKLLRQAAKERYAQAEYDLAVSYERGKGVEKSDKKAWLYYLKAANDGDRQAQTETGRCFYHGIGTKRDFAKAVEWYRKAAIRGDSDAQYALGVAYEHGEGVEKDIRAAIGWYKRAAMQGDVEAKKALAELRNGSE